MSVVVRLLHTAVVAVLVAASPVDARAFAVLGNVFDRAGNLELMETLHTTDRWSVDAAGGLHDGTLSVGIDPGLAASFGITDPEQRALVEQAVIDGVLLWSSPVLSFDVAMAASDRTREIEIRGAPDAEVYALGGGQGGIALLHSEWSEDRTLSNGSQIPGWSITYAEIVLNATTMRMLLLEVGLPIEVAVNPLLHLAAHEVGHGLGIGHPTDNPAWNIDDDSNPLNRLVVDPTDPFARLRVSTNVDDTAMMVPASDLPTFGVAFETRLSPDDRAARNVLYPENPNDPPVCSEAEASPSLLWPPDRKMVAISIEGVTDPDGDLVETTVTRVTQDEWPQGGGASNAAPAAELAPLALRAARNGRGMVPGNGRVYHVSFSAEDGSGGVCEGVVTVCVPHDAAGAHCIDEGPLHISAD
jgi:hypothetical protein